MSRIANVANMLINHRQGHPKELYSWQGQQRQVLANMLMGVLPDCSPEFILFKWIKPAKRAGEIIDWRPGRIFESSGETQLLLSLSSCPPPLMGASSAGEDKNLDVLCGTQKHLFRRSLIFFYYFFFFWL